MIVTKLLGGLGNQMFQYAAGRRLAVARGTGLALDMTFFDYDTTRVYELAHFAIKATPVDTQNIIYKAVSDEPAWKVAVKRVVRPNPFRLRPQYGFSFTMNGLVDDGSGRVGVFEPVVLEAADNSYLAGFWQSEKYFRDAEREIRSDFTFVDPLTGANEAMAEQIAATTAVSLHVRRGDYVSVKAYAAYHGEASLDFYRSAIDHIGAAVQNPHIYVFSDEPEWCKTNLTIDHPTTYVDHNPPQDGFEDMRLMSLCQHHIIANSSFSWWGAWLNPSPTKLVVGPRQWFRDAGVNADDVLPEAWIAL